MSLSFCSQHRGDQRGWERWRWREGGQTDWLSRILWFLPMLLEGWSPGCFSAAHMDEINLCVYDRLIYAPVSMGARLLVEKAFCVLLTSFLIKLSVSLSLSSVPSSSPSPQLGLLWSWTWACSLPDNWQMLWRASVLLFSAAPGCLHARISVCVRNAATQVFMASCSSLLPRVSGGNCIPSAAPSTPLRFCSLTSLTTFPFPLLVPLPFPSTLSHSRQPQVCISLSHASALVRWALLSVKPQTWDMRNGKWENKQTRTLTGIYTPTYIHTYTMYDEEYSGMNNVSCCSKVSEALWNTAIGQLWLEKWVLFKVQLVETVCYSMATRDRWWMTRG